MNTRDSKAVRTKLGVPLKAKRSKYNNIKTKVGSLVFDSKKEARRWGELLLLAKAGRIQNLQRQSEFPLLVNDRLICTYVADFFFDELVAGTSGTFRPVVEDVKSEFTKKLPVYRIKSKLMQAIHGITIREV